MSVASGSLRTITKLSTYNNRTKYIKIKIQKYIKIKIGKYLELM